VLNGVAVDATLAAFGWGRLIAVDPARAERLLAPGTPVATLETLATEDLIAHRVKHLTAYQNAALADRYKALVARVRETEKALGPDDRLTRAVADVYARLLAYKDEYEVARLFADPAFKAGLAEQFEGKYAIAFNLAPPFLKGEDADGRPKKRRFGRWMLPAFGLLAKLKGLRGTAFDPFGRTAERRMERQLIADYAALVEHVLQNLRRENRDDAVALLSFYGEIRGYGPVKEAAVKRVRAREAQMRTAFDLAGRQKTAA
jgi:indolepyruvate ferredoxin oxidoreductase